MTESGFFNDKLHIASGGVVFDEVRSGIFIYIKGYHSIASTHTRSVYLAIVSKFEGNLEVYFHKKGYIAPAIVLVPRLDYFQLALVA